MSVGASLALVTQPQAVQAQLPELLAEFPVHQLPQVEEPAVARHAAPWPQSADSRCQLVAELVLLLKVLLVLVVVQLVLPLNHVVLKALAGVEFGLQLVVLVELVLKLRMRNRP